MLTHPLREPSDRKEERGREGEGAGRTRRGEGKRGIGRVKASGEKGDTGRRGGGDLGEEEGERGLVLLSHG